VSDPERIATIFKALSDPVRLDIVRQMTQVDELANQTLERRLSISKPTISYHIRILTQAGLVSTHKKGRYFYYTLQRQPLRDLVDELWVLAPAAMKEFAAELPDLPALPDAQLPDSSSSEAKDVLLTW
jgi:DNA-binding transcriptional ArsR family regulator